MTNHGLKYMSMWWLISSGSEQYAIRTECTVTPKDSAPASGYIMVMAWTCMVVCLFSTWWLMRGSDIDPTVAHVRVFVLNTSADAYTSGMFLGLNTWPPAVSTSPLCKSATTTCKHSTLRSHRVLRKALLCPCNCSKAQERGPHQLACNGHGPDQGPCIG